MNVLVENSVEELVRVLNPKYNISVISFKDAELVGDKVAKAYARCVDLGGGRVIRRKEVVCKELNELGIEAICVGDN